MTAPTVPDTEAEAPPLDGGPLYRVLWSGPSGICHQDIEAGSAPQAAFDVAKNLLPDTEFVDVTRLR